MVVRPGRTAPGYMDGDAGGGGADGARSALYAMDLLRTLATVSTVLRQCTCRARTALTS